MLNDVSVVFSVMTFGLMLWDAIGLVLCFGSALCTRFVHLKNQPKHKEVSSKGCFCCFFCDAFGSCLVGYYPLVLCFEVVLVFGLGFSLCM